MSDRFHIESLGAQGDGVTADGVFISGALPGETVRAKAQGHRAELIEVLQPSADRVVPTCRHFGSCGGCALQHASDGLLAGWKRDLVFRALEQRGISKVEIRPTITSPPGTRRRVVLTGRRTKKTAILGFHGAASDTIEPISECPVADPRIVAKLAGLAELVQAGASRKGALRVTVTTSEAGLDVAAEGGKPIEGGLYGQLVAVAATKDLARLSWNGDVVVSRRPPVQHFGPIQMVPPPGGFLQATSEGEEALIAQVLSAVRGATRIADLFCGSGTFTLPLATGAQVHAVEQEEAALQALDAAWRYAEGLRPVSTEARDLFHRPLLARDLAAYDAVVIDPPRAGARAQTEELAKSDVPLVASVSCNPATFARDARTLLDAGFRLDWVQPIDQFRWSPHVELAARLSRT